MDSEGEKKMNEEAEYVDFKGWRFKSPWRCLCCGRRISLEQFCFGRCCGACDLGKCQHPKYRGCFSGPRQLIDRNAENFLKEDRWLNPEEGLQVHLQDHTFDEEQAWVQYARKKHVEVKTPLEERIEQLERRVRQLERRPNVYQPRPQKKGPHLGPHFPPFVTH